MLGVKLFILMYLAYVAKAQYRGPAYLFSSGDIGIEAIPTSLVKSPRTRSVLYDPKPEITSVIISKRANSQPYRTLFKPNRTPTVKHAMLNSESERKYPSELRYIDELETVQSKFILEPEIEIIESEPKLEVELKLDSQSNSTSVESESENESDYLETEVEFESKIEPEPSSTETVTPEEKPNVSISSRNSISLKPEVEIDMRPEESNNTESEIEISSEFKPGVKIQCIDKNAYYPIPNACDVFIECKKFVATKKLCPDGLLFNRRAKWPQFPCSYPSEVECGNVTHTVYFEPVGVCPRRFGNFPSSNNDCEKYIVCHDGRPSFMSCPMGLAFNTKIGACDWPANVPNCNPKVFKDFACPVPKDGQVDKVHNYRYKKSCKLYFACIKGVPRLLRCDSGLSFDDKTSRCIHSDAVRNCRSVSEIVDTKLYIRKGQK